MVSTVFNVEQKRNSNRGISLPPPPPLGGGVGVGKSNTPVLAVDDRQLWLRQNLPGVAAAIDCFAAEFGRDGFKVAFAAENGHVIGKRAEFDGVKLSETVVGPLKLKAGK